MRRDSRQHGFAPVELVVTTVIIGIMIGAVFKGQDMINDAKQRRFLNDLQGISAAFFTYHERYNSVPGDDSRTHGWEGLTAGDADGFIEGHATDPGGESQEAWKALRYARLLAGDPAVTGAASLPNHPYGAKYGLLNMNFGAGIGTKNYILAVNIPGSVAESLDIQFDDGIYNTGTVQGSAAYTTSTQVHVYYAL